MGGLIGNVTSEKNGLFTPTLLSQVMIIRNNTYDIDDKELPSGLYGINTDSSMPSGNNWSGFNYGMYIVFNGIGLANGGWPRVQVAISHPGTHVKIRMNWLGSWSNGVTLI